MLRGANIFVLECDTVVRNYDRSHRRPILGFVCHNAFISVTKESFRIVVFNSSPFLMFRGANILFSRTNSV